MSEKPRPIGVTLVGILYLLMSLIAFVGAMGFLLWAGLSNNELTAQLPDAPVWLVGGGSLVLAFIGLIIFLVAVVNLAIALGCFRGWGWIWSWALVFAVLNIFFAMFNAFGQGLTLSALWIGLIGSILPIVVLLYLNTRKVKVFFGKA
jgi:hypothetical protein